MRSCFVHLTIGLVLFLCCAVTASAQSAGIMRGSVMDASGASIVSAGVTIEDATGGYSQTISTDEEGRYMFFNLPFNSYILKVEQSGFTTSREQVALRTNVPVEHNVTLAVASVGEEVEITADSNSGIEPTRSEIAVDSVSIENLTSALPSRQIESLVLSVPGIVRDGKGVFHARGAHNQSSFVIDFIFFF